MVLKFKEWVERGFWKKRKKKVDTIKEKELTIYI